MSVEIAWKQNILVTDFQLLKSLLVVLGFGSQAFVCGFSRQNICSVKSGVAHQVEHFAQPISCTYSCSFNGQHSTAVQKRLFWTRA